MKLLLDQGLARSTVQHLAAVGISAEHVGDLGLAAARDEAILEAARLRQSVVVTLDADFHQHLAVTRATTPSVIRIRIERLKGDEVAKIVEQVIAMASTEIAAGAVVSVTKTKIRVRSLPIGR
jgi:predicted nuclease of predicted toxin-antitoxin system